MERTRPMRKQKKPKVENYYKILGIRANATNEIIKKSYITLVKQYSPEHYPEEFQRIRRAYETLRDPVKRQQYDFQRKFGGSVEKMFEEAMEYMEQERWAQAENLFSQILELSPDAIGAALGLAQSLLLQDKFDAFERQMELAYLSASSIDDKVKALMIKAKLLLENDYLDKALGVLMLLQHNYPSHANECNALLSQVYQRLGRSEDAWKLIDADIPSPGEEQPEDIHLFVAWINAMIDLKKWNLWGKIQQRVKQFLKKMTDADDRWMAVIVLISESREYCDVMRFRDAEIFLDLAYYIDPKNQMVQTLRREIQELSRISKELDRMERDMDMMPLVWMQALEWFYEEIGDEEEASMVRAEIPPQLLLEMESMTELFASGIRRLQTKYPLVYQRYRESWDKLYTQKTTGLNREARRRLR